MVASFALAGPATATAQRGVPLPRDVAALVPEVLDPGLFDVTALVEMGYDDEHARALPLIVRGAAGSPLRRRAQLEASARQPSSSTSATPAS